MEENKQRRFPDWTKYIFPFLGLMYFYNFYLGYTLNIKEFSLATFLDFSVGFLILTGGLYFFNQGGLLEVIHKAKGVKLIGFILVLIYVMVVTQIVPRMD